MTKDEETPGEPSELSDLSSMKGQIVFPLNVVTCSFGLPNNVNIEEFLSKLSKK